MTPSLRLIGKRRFLPLFVTQFLGAFNDNLFKTAMVMLVTYQIYNDPAKEASFNAIAGGIFILPFFLFSALSGQLADSHDKARIIRTVKSAEIVIMICGAAGLLLSSIPVMLAALFAMGVHSTFFGPIKYAILPQHLQHDEVLGGTGMIEAGTYGAILLGTIAGGLIPHDTAAIGVLVIAVIGRIAGAQVPAAPPEPDANVPRIDWHIIRSSITLVSATLHIPRLFLAIAAYPGNRPVTIYHATSAAIPSVSTDRSPSSHGGPDPMKTPVPFQFRSAATAVGSRCCEINLTPAGLQLGGTGRAGNRPILPSR